MSINFKEREKMVVVMKKVSENYVINAKKARKEWPGALVLDVTLEGAMGRLDPAFPVGGVIIPGREKWRGLSVKGVFEGMKVFERRKMIDESFFFDEKKLGKTRGCKSYGKLLGVRVGEETLEGMEKVREVYENLYRGTVSEKFEKWLESLRKEKEKKTIVLLDYAEEGEMRSHAEILKEMIEMEP